MITARPDLLVIGGLTVDRFADGSSAPGGTVLHVARAAAPRQLGVAIVTVAGPEAQAQAGLDELRRLAIWVRATEAGATATFAHRDSPRGRRLAFVRGGGRVRLGDLGLRDAARAILVAPIAGEIATEDLARLDTAATRGVILQGFLRTVIGTGEVRQLPLSALPPGLAAALGGFDVLVASREDLLGEAAEPPAQLAALRRCVGAGPTLVVTDGVEGVWTEGEQLPVPRRVDGVSSVGAGDVFAAFLLAGQWPHPAPADFVRARVELAMRIVVEALQDRRG